MGLAAVLASTLLALDFGAYGNGTRLARVDPATLRGEGSALRLPNALLGYAWARRGRTLALVVKPVATGQPIRIIDVKTLRVRRTIEVGDRDVCGLTFQGRTLVALTADRPCYRPGGRFAILRVDPARRAPMRIVSVPGIHTAFPTNLAFGDGDAFVAHAGGGVNAIDLRTGVTTPHWPRRQLAKGEGIVWTRWLGRHLLGVGSRLVDVRTWHARVLVPGARGLTAAGPDIVAYGPAGASIFTRAWRLRLNVLRGEDVGDARVVGRYLYATIGEATDVVDLRAGRDVRVIPHSDAWVLLAP
jgi:hypothetical protein